MVSQAKLKQLVRCSINLSFVVPQNKNKTFILTLTVSLLDWFEKIKKKEIILYHVEYPSTINVYASSTMDSGIC